jgi:hypothetical protein
MLTRFAMADSGAITVDWVVLTAAVVGLGVATVAGVRGGTQALGTDIEASLTSASVVGLVLPFEFVGLSAELVESRRATYSAASTDQIIAWHQARAASLPNLIAQGRMTPTGDIATLSAPEVLDVLYLHREELVRRGAYPVDGVPEFPALLNTYRAAL